MELQEKVEKRIKLMGLKKTFVADKCGIGKSTFSLFLKNERTLRPEQEKKLIELLGL
jgi:hypothetical protein